jgi:hypothetical protein
MSSSPKGGVGHVEEASFEDFGNAGVVHWRSLASASAELPCRTPPVAQKSPLASVREAGNGKVRGLGA